MWLIMGVKRPLGSSCLQPIRAPRELEWGDMRGVAWVDGHGRSVSLEFIPSLR